MRQKIIIALTSFILFFLVTRFFNVMAFPIFVDEGLHISRAQQMAVSGDFIHGTAAGKFLHVWALTSVIYLTDFALPTARFLSILTGLTSGLAVFCLARLLWPHRNLGWLAAFIYIALPLPLMNDRLALADSLLTTLITLVLTFSLKYIKQPEKLTGYALGICLGLTYLTKTNGLIYLPIPFLALILLRPDWPKTIKSLFLPYFVAFVFALPTATEFLNQFLSVAVRGVPHPAQTVPTSTWWLYSLGETWFDLTSYVTWPILLLASMQLLVLLRKGDRRAPFLIVLLLITPAAYTLLGKDVWYSRYLLPTVPIFVVLAARTLSDLAYLLARVTKTKQEPLWLSILCLLALWPSFRFTYHYITEPSGAPLTPVDRWQYIVGWPAGYGLAESIDWLEQRVVADGPVTVITTHHSGPTQEGLRLYLQNRQVVLNLVSLDLQKENGSHIKPLVQDNETTTLLFLNEPVDQINDLLQGLCPDVLAVFPKPENQSRLVIKECPTNPPAITTQAD